MENAKGRKLLFWRENPRRLPHALLSALSLDDGSALFENQRLDSYTVFSNPVNYLTSSDEQLSRTIQEWE